MASVRITAPTAPLRATIQLPRSKSAANRALVIAALLGDLDLVRDPGDGDDTRILEGYLRKPAPVMDCGAGATTFRFLLAWACCHAGHEHLITGSERLLARPHDDLVDALRTLGADITREAGGYRVRGRKLQGGHVHFDSPISSQYLSALLLIAPAMEQGLHLRWTGTRLSEPYVHMTLRIMSEFGVFPAMELDGVHVPPGPYQRATYTVPADWSAAGAWYEAVALSPDAQVLLPGLDEDTLQGDRRAVQLWDPWVATTFGPEGAQLVHRKLADPLPAAPIVLRNQPDLFQPLAATCAGLGVEAHFNGLDNLRVKETDRLNAMAHVLRAMGCKVRTEGGAFDVQGAVWRGDHAAMDPEADHRMAMAIAPLALVAGPLTIAHPSVVNKSYPGYWEALRTAGFQVEEQA
jgi:3-phosphoshikimate 1-carboxyvinyltransferase